MEAKIYVANAVQNEDVFRLCLNEPYERIEMQFWM